MYTQTNCLTEIFFDEALERAREIDAHKKATGKPLGPLAGLPISLSESKKIEQPYRCFADFLSLRNLLQRTISW